jgi:signal transduction histidine kinase/CheY-like chemotaxis protein
VRRSIAPWAALGGSLAVTLAAAAFVFGTERARDLTIFRRAVRIVEDRLQRALDLDAARLRGASALFAAHPGATADEFRSYAAALDLQGLKGLGYARRVRRTETGQVESELQQSGFAGLRIWPDLGREERTAVVALEPLGPGNRAVIGYDMLSDPARREAMERARDTADVALTGKVALAPEGDQPGFILYQPVYRGGTAPGTVTERREALIGFVFGLLGAADFFAGIPAPELEPYVDFSVSDRASPARSLRERGAPAGQLTESALLRVGGREWTLSFVSLPALDSDVWPAAAALCLGTLVSGFVFMISWREARERQRAEAAAGELRKLLEERKSFEDQLREESRVNSILRRLGISLAAELDPDRLAQLVADEAAALTGAELGAMFDAHRRLLALGGTLRGEARRLSLQSDSPTVARTLRGERAVRLDDLGGAGPVFSEGAPRVRSYLAIPVLSRTGEVLAGLFFGHSQPGTFTEHHERLVLGLAAQASIALDNARLLRDLQDSDRRKDEFIAVLGHELRNPLAPVLTALEVAKRDPSSAARQIAILERQARHMVRIVDDLLDIARISRGRIELKRQPLSVNEALVRAAEAISPLALARQQKLIVQPPKEPLLVDADPVRLEQILGNLLSNAIKYTPGPGEVELAAERRGSTLEIRVRDTGIGIPPEAQASLFEPFIQTPHAKDYSTGGLGIGLSLVKGLVELHGGTVAVHSEGSGCGSLFTVRLPGATRGSTPVEVRPAQPRARIGRVLVVDDNADAAMTLAEAVRLDGHEVQIAHDGLSALEQAAVFAPEVVLLDIGLPGIDGYEVVRRLRQIPPLQQSLIVALTGFGQESDRERALKAGFDEHLTKPADLDTIQSVLLRRLGVG